MGEVNNKYAYLNHLSTPELEKLLEFDPEGIKETDPEMLLYILKVIEQRDSANAEARQVETEKTLQELFDRYNDPERQGRWLYSSEVQDDEEEADTQYAPRKKHRQLRRTLIIAAVVACLLALMIPTVLGDNGFIERIGQWNDDTFYFKSDDGMYEQNEDLMELQSKLDEYGVTEAVLPNTLPEGFERIEFQIVEKPAYGHIDFYMTFKNSNQFFSLTILKNTAEKKVLYEKEGEHPEIVSIQGIDHYFLVNRENVSVSWQNNHIECNIQGNITIDDLKTMVNSIYER